MQKQYKINGLTIPVINANPCLRVMQYMKSEPITCACSQCLIDNAGMTNDEIRARMDKAYV